MSHLGPTRTARAHRITRERARANSLSSLRENGTRLLLETPGGGSLRGARSGRGLSPTARAASSFQAGQGGLLISRTETTGASLLSHFRQLDPRFVVSWTNTSVSWTTLPSSFIWLPSSPRSSTATTASFSDSMTKLPTSSCCELHLASSCSPSTGRGRPRGPAGPSPPRDRRRRRYPAAR